MAVRVVGRPVAGRLHHLILFHGRGLPLDASGRGLDSQLLQNGEKTCATIVFTPRARVLGVPNSVLAQLFYPVIAAGTVEGFLFTFPIFHLSLLASLVTVLLGLFLTYSLLFLTRVPCILCFTSHGINFIIFGLLILEKNSISGSLW